MTSENHLKSFVRRKLGHFTVHAMAFRSTFFHALYLGYLADFLVIATTMGSSDPPQNLCAFFSTATGFLSQHEQPTCSLRSVSSLTAALHTSRNHCLVF